jgi:hypothetical protein
VWCPYSGRLQRGYHQVQVQTAHLREEKVCLLLSVMGKKKGVLLFQLGATKIYVEMHMHL